tara:strand:+ start:687 stop:1223 length:537 start_codon:yes stop_codon:yes gene_type:complete
MLSKSPIIQKISIYTLLLALLLFYGCASLDIVPNKTDRFKDAQKSKGNTLEIESKSLTERFMQMIPGVTSENVLNNTITFEVALDQFSILPLLSVDRLGGIIITDWYSTSTKTNERVKFNIIIKNENMDENSIDIKMFKELFDGTKWNKVLVDEVISNSIKDIILNKSRKLKTTAELS